MTDDEKRELIAEAEEFVKYGADLNPMEAERLIGELCGALEGTLTEPEWEYGTAHRATPEFGASEYSRERAEERVREWNETTQSERGLLVRRRKAGPWEVVSDV